MSDGFKVKRYPTAKQVCAECGGSSINYLAPAWFRLDDSEIIEHGDAIAYKCGDCERVVDLVWDMGLGPEKPDPDAQWEEMQTQGLTRGRK